MRGNQQSSSRGGGAYSSPQSRNGSGGRSRPQAQQQQADRQKPIKEFTLGLIKGTVWENESKEGTFLSVAITRIYKDGQGEWKTAHTFGRHDLLVAAEVARLCYHFIVARRGSDQDPGGYEDDRQENGGR